LISWQLIKLNQIKAAIGIMETDPLIILYESPERWLYFALVWNVILSVDMSIYLPHQILPCKSFRSFITRWKNTPHILEGATEQEFPFLLKVEAPWMWTVAWIIRFRTFWLFCYWECHAPHISSMYYSFSRIYTFLLNF
jgi:hypothetical protein